MVKGFYRWTAETRKGNWQSEGCQALCLIQHTMCQLLVQIHDLMVDVEERPGTPHGGLVERAKSE